MTSNQHSGEIGAWLRELIPASARSIATVCKHHAERRADAMCSVCGALVCRSCALLDAETLSVCCPACREGPACRGGPRIALGLLRTPATAVVLICLMALIAFLLGVGNPSLADLRTRDAGKEWFRQEAGRLCLAQADRTRSRSQMLALKGDIAASQAWADLSARAFGNGAEAWAGAPVENDMRIGQGLMMMHANRPAAAWQLVQGIAVPADADPSRRFSFHLQRGRIALAAGETDTGATELQRVLGHVAREEVPGNAGSGLDFVDRIADVYAKDRRVAFIQIAVHRVCETALDNDELRRGATEALRTHGLPIPAEASPGSPDVEAPVVPTPAPTTPRRAIVIKHLQDR